MGNTRTDEQLLVILHDTADWAINGNAGTLCFAASLQRAIARAADLAASGAVITALSRRPFDNIVIDPDQMRRLRKFVAGREELPIKQSDLWPDFDDAPSG